MVKYFCDKCGKEIEDGERYAVRGFIQHANPMDFSNDDFCLDKMLCEDCFDEVLALIGGDESE